MSTGVDVAGHPVAVHAGQETVDRPLVEQLLAYLPGQVHGRHLGSPQLVDPGRRGVLSDSLYHGRRADQGVVGSVGHRPVARGAPHGQPAPRDPLLADCHADRRRLGRTRMDTARLGEHIVSPDGLRVILGHPPGPVGAARLLVGHCEVDQIAGRPEPLVGQAPKGNRLGRGEVQHVHRAPSPHLPVN